jgi:uncharacterized damage-inducible protein DinB
VNKRHLEDLMAYADYAWAEIQASFESSDEALHRPAPGSGWPAMRNCLAHILLGRDRWNDAIIDLRSTPVADLAEDALGTWVELNAYRLQTGDRLREFLNGCDERELSAVQTFDIDGEDMQYTRADLILHLVLHEVAHHGDVSTLMYQLGMEPWVPGYRFHVSSTLPG